jgi:uncharacterized membrane protein
MGRSLEICVAGLVEDFAMWFHVSTYLILLYLGCGALWILLGIPMISGMVARNGIYGFRTPKTLASDHVWYPANRYAGKEMVKAGRVVLIGSVFMFAVNFVFGLSLQTVAVGGLVLLLVPMMIAMIRSFVYLRTL